MSRRPTKNPAILWREEENRKYLVFNPETDNLFVLTKFGIEFLKLCNGQRTLDEICDILKERHHVSETVNFKNNLQKFNEEFKKRNLIL